MTTLVNQLGLFTVFVCVVFQLLTSGLPLWFKLFKSGLLDLRLAFLACLHVQLFSYILAAISYSRESVKNFTASTVSIQPLQDLMEAGVLVISVIEFFCVCALLQIYIRAGYYVLAPKCREIFFFFKSL